MKIKIFLALTVLFICSCNKIEQKQSKMNEKATIVEMVLFKTNEETDRVIAQKAITELNNFLSKQQGFIARKTSVAEDNQFLDIVFWTDLKAAKTASERAMENPQTMEAFKVIDEKNMILKHFSIFNEFEKSIK